MKGQACMLRSTSGAVSLCRSGRSSHEPGTAPTVPERAPADNVGSAEQSGSGPHAVGLRPAATE